MLSVLPLDGYRDLVADFVFLKQLEEVVGNGSGLPERLYSRSAK